MPFKVYFVLRFTTCAGFFDQVCWIFFVTLENSSGVTQCVWHCYSSYSPSRYRLEENKRCVFRVGGVKVERAAQSAEPLKT